MSLRCYSTAYVLLWLLQHKYENLFLLELLTKSFFVHCVVVLLKQYSTIFLNGWQQYAMFGSPMSVWGQLFGQRPLKIMCSQAFYSALVNCGSFAVVVSLFINVIKFLFCVMWVKEVVYLAWHLDVSFRHVKRSANLLAEKAKTITSSLFSRSGMMFEASCSFALILEDQNHFFSLEDLILEGSEVMLN